MLPMDRSYITGLDQGFKKSGKPGAFFKGEFVLEEAADTYIDMSDYTKGIVWTNGNNLGRYWNIGPQPQPLLSGFFPEKGR